jgi:hypothetical protein
MLKGKQIEAGTITQAQLGLSAATLASQAVIKSQMDSAIATALASFIVNSDFKESCLNASNGNVNIAAPGTFTLAFPSGFSSPVVGVSRLFLWKQTLGQENGIYIWQGISSPLTRAIDCDTSVEVTPGMMSMVEEGTHATRALRLTTTGAITLGTTPLSFEIFNIAEAQYEQITEMAAVATTGNGQLCHNPAAIGMTWIATMNTKFIVKINGLTEKVGQLTAPCYFSNDGGATALSNYMSPAHSAGARLYWNGSIAGYQLAATDLIEITYLVG